MSATRPFHRLPRLAAATVLTLTVAGGCSVPRLLYQHADWLLLRQMDSYLDLSDGQRERVARALEMDLERHRAEVLPSFAATFAEAAARARRGLVAADARWIVERARELAVASAEEALPTVASALATLDSRQREHLSRRMDERNQEFVEEHALDAPREERFRRRAERTVDRVEDWTGPLSQRQAELVRGIRNAMPDSAPEWLDYTRERQRALLGLLERGAGATEIESLLRGWWLRLDALPPGLAAKRDRQVEALVSLIVRLDASLDSVQRHHLVDRLEDLARDARELAARA